MSAPFDKRDFTFKRNENIDALDDRLKNVEKDLVEINTDVKHIREDYGAKINTIGADVAFIRGVLEGKGVKEERAFSLKSGIYITVISAGISIAVAAILHFLDAPIVGLP